MTLKLYRIENGDGVGPWKGGLADIHRRIAREEVARNPFLYRTARSPAFMDNQRGTNWAARISGDHIFGCKTLDDLRLWYASPKGCAAMAKAGARLATYDVDEDHLLEGAWEVAFVRHKARRVEVAPLADLHRKARDIPAA